MRDLFGNDLTFEVDEEIAVRLGSARQAAAASHSTERFFSDPNIENIRGVKGEMAFSLMTGLAMKTVANGMGDDGIDHSFVLSGRPVHIDVKTYEKPYNLLLKVSEENNKSDILVLALLDGNSVTFLGWEHKSLMLLMPVKDFGYGIRNHYRPASELRDMKQLLNLIRMADVDRR